VKEGEKKKKSSSDGEAGERERERNTGLKEKGVEGGPASETQDSKRKSDSNQR